MKTHRCKGSLYNFASIRFNGARWVLRFRTYNYEIGDYHLLYACPIDYCPFCGKELEED